MIDQIDLDELRASLGPSSIVIPDYVPPTWNSLLAGETPVFRPGRPSAYVKATSKSDVVAVCEYAAKHGIKVSPRGTGHHYGGLSLLPGSLLLDLAPLDTVHVDPAARTAAVGPGATGRALAEALAGHGLHFPLPHISAVGLGGFLLGGGNGWAVRQWGAAADNVEEVEVVLMTPGAEGRRSTRPEGDQGVQEGEETVQGGQDAAAQSAAGPGGGSGVRAARGCGHVCVRRVRRDTDPELFWGLCGAGGHGGLGYIAGLRLALCEGPRWQVSLWHLHGIISGAFLGVATGFLLRLHPAPGPSLHLITATFPYSAYNQVADFFREFHLTNPPCVEASLSVVAGEELTEDEGQGMDKGGAAARQEWVAAEGAAGQQQEGADAAAAEGQQRVGGGAAAPAAAAEGRSVGPVRRHVVVLSCHGFAPPGEPEMEAAYDKLRGLLPSARLSLAEELMPYTSAMAVLDPYWDFPGLCMYGHGTYLPPGQLLPGGAAMQALLRAGASLPSPQSILLLAPSAPSGRGNHEAAAPAPAQPPNAANGGGGAADEEQRQQQEQQQQGGGTAMCFRDTLFVGIYAMWRRTEAGPSTDGDAACAAWVRSAASDLSPHVAGCYVNEVMMDSPGQLGSCYDAATRVRLEALKARVDPRGLLRALDWEGQGGAGAAPAPTKPPRET